MLFDLEPYIPFNLFITLWIVISMAVAVWGVDRKKGK